MAISATTVTAPRSQLERAPELTLDALLARMRSAAELSLSSRAALRTGNGLGGGETADPVGLLEAQIDFNQALVSAVNSIAQYLKHSRIAVTPAASEQRPTTDLLPRVESLAAQGSDLTQRLDLSLAALNAADQSHRAMIDALVNGLEALQQAVTAAQQQALVQAEQLNQHVAGSQAANQHLHHEFNSVMHRNQAQLAEIELRLLRAERDLRKQTKAADPAAADPTPSSASPTADIPFDYFLFEHRFRGPTEEIKRRQQAYLDDFRAADNVLDLGCGRGEFVELLVERGTSVIGVDLNGDMVDLCRSRGLPVVRGDLFEYLARQIDGSIGGIFISQVVEHLPAERVWKLIQLAAARLKTDGVLLLETINPHCPQAMNWFYLDPTHVRPYPPALLSFMCEQAGFRLDRVQFSGPLPGAASGPIWRAPRGAPPDDAGQYQDYATIARRLRLGQVNEVGFAT